MQRIRDSSSTNNVETADAGTQQRSSLPARVVSGSIGSIITSLVVTPLHVVKVRLQASSVETASASASAHLLPRNVAPCPMGCGTFVLYNGQMDCVLPKSSVSFFDHQTGRLTDKARAALFAANSSSSSKVLEGNHQLGTFSMLRRIFASEGFSGIYAGLRPTLVMAVPNTVLYFSAYDEIVWRMRAAAAAANDNDGSFSWCKWIIPLGAGASARLVASTATAPFEFLRTRQASLVGSNQQLSAGGLLSDFRTIIQTEGVGALYSGLRPTLWRDVPFSAIYWLCLEQMREWWLHYHNFVTPSPVEQAGQAFVNGAVSGVFAAACTTPFDVVKTRQQQVSEATEGVALHRQHHQTADIVCSHNGAAVYKHPSRSSKAGALREAGTFQYMRHIAETEGIHGLWRGNQARMLKVAPACAIMISSYEFGKRIME